jgi:chromosome segregation ATPase
MATRKAKERTQKSLARLGLDAKIEISSLEGEVAALKIDLERARAARSEADERLFDEREWRGAEAAEREASSADFVKKIRQFEIELEYERVQLRDLGLERDRLATELELTRAALEDAGAELSRRAKASKVIDTALKDNRKLRRRTAELRADLAQANAWFHRACQKLARYDRDASRALFAEAQGIQRALVVAEGEV